MNTSPNPDLPTVVAALRPPFLVLGPTSVLLGAAAGAFASVNDQPAPDWIAFTLALVCATLLHAAVNALNEYQDFHSGLDSMTSRTPFSGGSGALPANPPAAGKVLKTAVACLGLAVLIGLYLSLPYLSRPYGWVILSIGLAGILILLAYTPWINRSAWACLIAPGTGFGLLMVNGTTLVTAEHYSPTVWLASLVPFFLVNNLLLLNQFPDRTADQRAGRNHFVIKYGLSAGLWVYRGFLLATLLVICAAVLTGYFPVLAWISLLPLVPALIAARIAAAWINGGQQKNAPLIPGLGLNVITTLATPILLSISLFVG